MFFHNGTANRNAGMKIVDPTCPICPPPTAGEAPKFDGIIHLLCECSHTFISALRIARHQRAVRRITQEILRTISGKDTILVDIKKEDRDYTQLMDELDDSDSESDASPNQPHINPTETEITENSPTDESEEGMLREEWEEARDVAKEAYRRFQEESDCDLSDSDDSDYQADTDSEEEEAAPNFYQPNTRANPTDKQPETHSLRTHFCHLTGYTRAQYADIVTFHGADIDMTKPIPKEDRAKIHIDLIDFTYAGENPETLTRSINTKRAKYQPIVAALLRLGFKSASFIPVGAGVRGWNPIMCRTALIEQLHFTPARCTKVMNSFTRFAWQAIKPIVGARRAAELSSEHKHKSGLYAMKNRKRWAKAYQGEAHQPNRQQQQRANT
jgi:hypothetical protein